MHFMLIFLYHKVKVEFKTKGQRSFPPNMLFMKTNYRN